MTNGLFIMKRACCGTVVVNRCAFVMSGVRIRASGSVEEWKCGRSGPARPFFHTSTLPLFHPPPTSGTRRRKLRRQPIQQLRVRRRLAAGAEVAGGADDSGAEVVQPDAV